MLNADRTRPAARDATQPLASQPSAIAIGGSTGAPAALAQMLAGLAHAPIDAPIFVTIHVPGAFSDSLANALARAARRECLMITKRVAPRPGVLHLPGPDAHLRVLKTGRDIGVEAVKGVVGAFTPSVDHLFTSASSVFGMGLLAIVLTGTGADGLLGARDVVAAGGRVLAQSQSSSVASHMPAAVLAAKLATDVGGPAEMADKISRLFGGDGR